MERISQVLTRLEKAINESVDGSPIHWDLDAYWFGEQVAESRSDEVEMAKWASSTVIDDNVQAPVFSERVFSWLHYGVSGAFDFPIGHAGLMHVYGYLLSSVETPYGLKRQRWLTDDLARALGLKPSFLFPTASTVPLMQRVSSAVLPLLTDPAADSRTVLAVDEIVDCRRRMRTVYIRYPKTNSTALLYGSVSAGSIQIVTTFPVGQMTEQSAQDRLAAPTRYRYNYAPCDVLPGSHFDGTTQVLASSF